MTLFVLGGVLGGVTAQVTSFWPGETALVTPSGKTVILKEDGSWHYKSDAGDNGGAATFGEREKPQSDRRAGVVGFPFGIEADKPETWPCTSKAMTWEKGWSCEVNNGAYQLSALNLKVQRIKVFFQGETPETARVYRVVIRDVRTRPWLPAMRTLDRSKSFLI